MSKKPSSSNTPTGESELSTLIAKMNPVLDPRIFMFATTDEDTASKYSDKALMIFRESEGVTLILESKDAQAAGLKSDFECKRITLEIHSALEAVGFLAAIIPVLAEHNMGVNPVSAFFHDHLFVPAHRAEDALALLKNLSGGKAK